MKERSFITALRLVGLIVLLMQPIGIAGAAGLQNGTVHSAERKLQTDPQAKVEWLLVGDELKVIPGQGVIEVSAETLQRIKHAWVWTGQVPPQKVPRERLQRHQTPSIARDEEPAATSSAGWRDRLEVRLTGLSPDSWHPLPESSGESRNAKKRHARVIAAPLEMWLEVPENFLPSYDISRRLTSEVPYDSRYRWRLRALVPQTSEGPMGSWWHDLEIDDSRAVEVQLHQASDHSFTLVDLEGQRVTGGWLRVFPEKGSRSYCLYGPSEGGLEIPLLPDLRRLSITAVAPEYLISSIRELPSLLPEQITLHPGVSLIGSVVDPKGEPIPGARLLAEAWREGEPPIAIRRQSRSGADGGFRLEPLPFGRIVLRIVHSKFATWHETLDLLEEVSPGKGDSESFAATKEGGRGMERWTFELGALELNPNLELRVTVVDAFGSPIEGAGIRTSPAISDLLVTDREGQALISSIDPEKALEIEADAKGYLPRTTHSIPPHGPELEIQLPFAFTVEGRYVEQGGEPVFPGTVKARGDQHLKNVNLTSDGSFAIELKPERAYNLSLQGPTTSKLTVALDPGQPGEIRPLGDLIAPRSRTAVGRLVDGVTGEPVGGARVWTPRPNGSQPLKSWFFGDVLEVQSNAEGNFQLSGLAELPAKLRIEATGFGPKTVATNPKGEDSTIHLGDIELLPGTRLTVQVPGADEATTSYLLARLDPEQRWQEIDMLTAQVHGGKATLPDVPPGDATLTILRDGELACERTVSIPEGAKQLVVTCGIRDIRVTGKVLLGNRPASGGSLIWNPPPVEGGAIILKTRTRLGAQRTSVYGAGRTPQEIRVGADGTFVSESLTAGSWEVVWHGLHGSSTAPKTVQISSAASSVDIVLDYPDYRLRGTVLDRSGNPARKARVHERVTASTSPVSTDGSFEISGLGPGQYAIQAFDGDLRSKVVEVIVPPEGNPEPVELIVSSDREREQMTVRLLTPDDHAARGALVFVETNRHSQRLLTTNQQGEIQVPAGSIPPTLIRVAAFHQNRWLLGTWQNWDEASQEPVSLRFGPVGNLQIEYASIQDSHNLEVISANGWNITWLLRRLGFHSQPTPDTPLFLKGLPPGIYQLRDDLHQRSVEIRRDRTSKVGLD